MYNYKIIWDKKIIKEEEKEEWSPFDINIFPYQMLGYDSPYELIEHWEVYDYNGNRCKNDQIMETQECLSEDDWRIYLWKNMQYMWY